MIHAVHDRFFDRARELRRHFDRNFADPRAGHGGRFVWDFWHVPDEYTLLRTPAWTYFPKTLYARFHNHLVRWGRENLGCHDVSPPWLSCYVDGCRQHPHRDVPHGPLAFVYSLTRWERRRFTGGETFLTKPRLTIEPRFNRLTLFKPSITHGVRRVRGTHDPREGRLVIHGWFVNPRPFWTGPLEALDVRDAIEGQLAPAVGRLRLGEGLLSLRLDVTKAGRVARVRRLVSTLDRAPDEAKLMGLIESLTFSRRSRPSRLTLPLVIG